MAKSKIIQQAAPPQVDDIPVSYIKKELENLLPRYVLIEDCLNGQDHIKEKTIIYLPTPDTFVALGPNRYTGYLARAVFYGVAERTLDGMVGEVFSIDPVVEVPKSLDKLMADITGGGLSVKQLAKQATREVLAFGRAGLFADYPNVAKPATKLQLDSGEIRPTLLLYKSIDIINWRTFKRGSRILLNLIVLRESVNVEVGAFGERTDIQYRVLKLENNAVYQQELWTDPSGSNSVYTMSLSLTPQGFNGKPFNEIPFTFVGAKDNDAVIDSPPLYSLCELNMAHYRNSADFEDLIFQLGQPTPWFTGITPEWIATTYPDGKAGIGANGNILLPENASAGLLQVAPNPLVKEGMDAKERQMVALGARLVEQKQVQRTATEASMETASEMSVLSSVANNVSQAVKWGLEWALWLVTGSEDENAVKYDLNSEFNLSKATPDEVRAAIEAWQKQAIAFEEMREVLREAGLATLDDADVQQTIADEANLLPNLGGDTTPGGGGQDTIGQDTLANAA